MRDLRSRWNLLVVVIALGLMAGCGALQADPRSAQNENSGQSLLANSPALNFGSVVVGNSLQADEYISNPTTSEVTITNAKASNVEYQVVSPSFPVTIAAGRGITLLVRFKPSAAGRASATILISSDAPNLRSLSRLAATRWRQGCWRPQPRASVLERSRSEQNRRRRVVSLIRARPTSLYRSSPPVRAISLSRASLCRSRWHRGRR